MYLEKKEEVYVIHLAFPFPLHVQLLLDTSVQSVQCTGARALPHQKQMSHTETNVIECGASLSFCMQISLFTLAWPGENCTVCFMVGNKNITLEIYDLQPA